MPLYEYQCDHCGHRFEAIRKFSDAPLEHCPKCDGAIRKLQSAPAIQFKGTGWYITDYAKKEGVTSGKNNETTGDAKPAEAGNTDSAAAGKSETSSAAESAPAAPSAKTSP
jgi:putative FmdB family regulatory protein